MDLENWNLIQNSGTLLGEKKNVEHQWNNMQHYDSTRASLWNHDKINVDVIYAKTVS